jgi:hypothetical protein
MASGRVSGYDEGILGDPGPSSWEETMATGKKVKPKATTGREKKPARASTPKATKPQVSPTPANTNGAENPGEDRIAEFISLSTREMVYHLLQHPEEWMDYANPKLGGKSPNELIANGQEDRVRSLLIAATLGMF